MDLPKLALLALLSISSYGGATQIKFDLRPKIFSGNISATEKAVNKKLKVVTYVPPKYIGYLRLNMNAEIWIQNLENRVIQLDGKVISISNSALEPNKTHDFFRYPVVIESNRKMQRSLIDLKQGKISVTARIKLSQNQSLVDILNSYTQALKIDKSPDLQ